MSGKWVDVGNDIAREKASQVLRDAVAVLLEGEEAGAGSIDGDQSQKLSYQPTRYAAAHASWEPYSEETQTPGLVSVSASGASHSSTPLPVTYTSATATSNKRPRQDSYHESSLGRRVLPYATGVSYEESQYDESVAPALVRRRSSDATMIRQYASTTHRTSSRYAYHHPHPPPPSTSSNQVSRLPLHRRRSSATEGSTNFYNEFDLFNGQLLESDSEDRG